MIDRPDTRDHDTAIDRNLELAFDHMRAMFDDTALLAQIPDGATVVYLPDDDPTLLEHNIALAIDLAKGGRNVYLHHVGATAPLAAATR